MREPKKHELEYAIGRLELLMVSRGLNESELDELSGVKQPTISKILHKRQEPSVDILEKLFSAMGLQLSDVLNAADGTTTVLNAYMATSLTDLTDQEDAEIRRVVEKVRACFATEEFTHPSISVYWPGEHTHPKKNSKFKPATVYLIDRSRASTFHFLVILCTKPPSFGVGQENEIATQAGVPAIRLLPAGISRMMTGSFIRAFDVPYSGSLSDGITFDDENIGGALRKIIKLHYLHAALYHTVNGNDFGPRLKKLIDTRIGDYRDFADKLGISLEYLQSMMAESLVVSNPSARLLKRMAVLLDETVGYLLGENEHTDTIYRESKENLHAWVRETDGLDARIVDTVFEEWKQSYFAQKVESSPISHRNEIKAMQKADWDVAYNAAKVKLQPSGQSSMFTT